uniref:Predicted protein n=1 Tax=Hordeum vulgare subsp. vulgare TaxID=112509 RepID=F2DAF8_HORVV|nr:predicted protein [Hordeum vulgare subsp. vulgare]
MEVITGWYRRTVGGSTSHQRNMRPCIYGYSRQLNYTHHTRYIHLLSPS